MAVAEIRCSGRESVAVTFLAAGFYYKTFGLLVSGRSCTNRLFAGQLGWSDHRKTPILMNMRKHSRSRCARYWLRSSDFMAHSAARSLRGWFFVKVFNSVGDCCRAIYRRHGRSTGLPVSLLSSRAFEVLLMSRTTVVGAYDSGTYAALERVSDFSTPPAHLPRQRLWRIVARRTVVACGAIERPMLSATTIGPGNVSIGSANLYKQVCRRRGAPHRSFHQ